MKNTIKILLSFIAIFSSSLFLSCSGLFETFQGTFHSTSDLAAFPKTDVSKYRIDRGFCFPENTPPYDILTCFGGINKQNSITHFNYNDSTGKTYGNTWTDIKITYSKENENEYYVVTIYNSEDTYSFPFTFNLYEGITEIENTNQSFIIYNQTK